jgi:hypothetical protein
MNMLFIPITSFLKKIIILIKFVKDNPDQDNPDQPAPDLLPIL